jgi:hypothetical protein
MDRLLPGILKGKKTYLLFHELVMTTKQEILFSVIFSILIVIWFSVTTAFCSELQGKPLPSKCEETNQKCPTDYYDPNLSVLQWRGPCPENISVSVSFCSFCKPGQCVLASQDCSVGAIPVPLECSNSIKEIGAWCGNRDALLILWLIPVCVLAAKLVLALAYLYFKFQDNKLIWTPGSITCPTVSWVAKQGETSTSNFS